MPADSDITCSVYDHHRLIASGPVAVVALAAKQLIEAGATGPVLILDDASSRPIEVDFRGSTEDVLARLRMAPEPASRGPGRPRLGVVPREITLLPRHWDWLGRQPGGASAVLRRLVENALRNDGAATRARESQESVDRFMRVMAGDLADYEEASRAFYRGDRAAFATCTEAWPQDLRTQLRRLTAIAWDEHADAVTAS